MDDPNLIKREAAGDRSQHPLHRQASLARVQALPWLLFIVVFALAIVVPFPGGKNHE